MAQLEAGAKSTDTELSTKLEAARAKAADMKVDTEAAKAKLLELVEAKKAELQEKEDALRATIEGAPSFFIL
jgi:hypothetical protein